jgi:uncharacterized protein (DUF2236 family)
MNPLAYVVKPPQASRRREDHGLFGPGSPTWAVWSHPALLIAGGRAAIVQMFHPPTAAGVAQHSVYQGDFHGRLRRTANYFATVALGDSRSAIEASDRLRRVHDHVTGIEPLTGQPYRARDPENQLWVHVTAWHSALYTYERYGPGQLSARDEARYWRECGVASELQDLEPSQVPGGRAAVREYFEAMRPALCVSEPARAIMRPLLRPPLSWELAPFVPLLPVLAAATVATIPRHMRQLGGFDQPDVVDAAVRPLARMTIAALTLPVLERLLATLAPEAYAVVHEALAGRPPLRDEIVSPAAARRRLAQGRSARCARVAAPHDRRHRRMTRSEATVRPAGTYLPVRRTGGPS